MSCFFQAAINRRTLFTVLFVIVPAVSLTYGKTEVPVFLFSGQSNMVGISSVNGLSSDQKETISNIMINVSADCDASKKGKWLPLGPGFGNTATNFGPELFFGRTLADSMPDQKIAFIKNAVNGAPLGTTSGYLPPSSNNGTAGNNYSSMMTHIEEAMRTFNDAFDTSEYTPRWAGFVWLQGETDALQGGSMADNYRTNLENLISDIREVCETPDLPVILPLISKSSYWVEADKIRAADVALRESLENIDTIETKHLNLLQDNMHYDAPGQMEIGYWSAIRWLGLEYEYRDPVPVARHRFTRPIEHSLVRRDAFPIHFFDLSGRRRTVSRNATERESVIPSLLIGKSTDPFHASTLKTVIIR